jgi:hypothetical protein
LQHFDHLLLRFQLSGFVNVRRSYVLLSQRVSHDFTEVAFLWLAFAPYEGNTTVCFPSSSNLRNFPLVRRFIKLF